MKVWKNGKIIEMPNIETEEIKVPLSTDEKLDMLLDGLSNITSFLNLKDIIKDIKGGE